MESNEQKETKTFEEEIGEVWKTTYFPKWANKYPMWLNKILFWLFNKGILPHKLEKYL